MKIKVIDVGCYVGGEAMIGKIIEAASEDVNDAGNARWSVLGSEMIKAGAPEEKVDPDYEYGFFSEEVPNFLSVPTPIAERVEE